MSCTLLRYSALRVRTKVPSYNRVAKASIKDFSMSKGSALGLGFES